VIHQPVSVVSQCSLIAWLKRLTSGDQRRLTGSGSALEATRNALYKSAHLLYTDGGQRPASVTGAMTSKVKGQGREVKSSDQSEPC